MEEPGVGAEPGWYPDYDAPPGHERYWSGTSWTDGRRTASAGGRGLRTPVRVTVAAVVVALVSAAVVWGLAGGREVTGAGSTPPPASRPGAPETASQASETDGGAEPAVRTWRVVGAEDGRTLELDNGALVRLVGIEPLTTGSCAARATAELSDLATARLVTLTRRGPDKDAEGHLLRYVERDGLDLGLRMLQRGLVTASAEPHARAQAYRRVDERNDASC